MSEIVLEKSELSDVQYASQLLRTCVAPKGGSVKMRIILAARRLNWSASRTKDVWYEHARIIQAHEMDRLKTLAGVRDARHEYKQVCDEIERIESLLMARDADFSSPILAGLRAFFSGKNSP